MTTKTSTDRTWKIGELLNWTANYLAKKDIEHPRLDAEILLAAALGCRRIDLYGLRHNDAADEEIRDRYRELIRRRVEGCPVAYLVGKKEFFSLEFQVTPAVLIPRPDSELLVTACLDISRSLSQPSILDVGTGSGNLAITAAHELPDAKVTAVDISPEAIELARRNADRHDVADRVRFLKGDMFATLSEGDRFDVILSNPPYIPTGDLPNLPVGVRDHEPVAALDGGKDGFAVFQRLITETAQRLNAGGHLLVEIGAAQEQAARERIENLDRFDLAPTIHDHAGHPRVLKARIGS